MSPVVCIAAGKFMTVTKFTAVGGTTFFLTDFGDRWRH